MYFPGGTDVVWCDSHSHGAFCHVRTSMCWRGSVVTDAQNIWVGRHLGVRPVGNPEFIVDVGACTPSAAIGLRGAGHVAHADVAVSSGHQTS